MLAILVLASIKQIPGTRTAGYLTFYEINIYSSPKLGSDATPRKMTGNGPPSHSASSMHCKTYFGSLNVSGVSPSTMLLACCTKKKNKSELHRVSRGAGTPPPIHPHKIPKFKAEY